MRIMDLLVKDLPVLSSIIGGIHADAIVYIFAHSHTALLTEINMLGRNYLQAAKEPVKLHTC